MKTLSLIVATLMSASAAFAGGTGEHSHDEMEVGRPGVEAEVTRTINVRMYETENGEYLYEPRDLSIKQERRSASSSSMMAKAHTNSCSTQCRKMRSTKL